MPWVPPGASPAAGPVAYSGLFSLAGAVGSATGLSLRSPRAVKIFSGTRATPPAAPAQSLSLPAEKHLARPGRPVALPPYYACVPSGAGTHHNPGPAAGDQREGRHAMNLTSSAETITCAIPAAALLPRWRTRSTWTAAARSAPGATRPSSGRSPAGGTRSSPPSDRPGSPGAPSPGEHPAGGAKSPAPAVDRATRCMEHRADAGRRAFYAAGERQCSCGSSALTGAAQDVARWSTGTPSSRRCCCGWSGCRGAPGQGRGSGRAADPEQAQRLRCVPALGRSSDAMLVRVARVSGWSGPRTRIRSGSSSRNRRSASAASPPSPV